MKHASKVFAAMLAYLLAVGPAAVAQDEEGGLLGNTYASHMNRTAEDILKITTRKRVRGDIEEASRPGTSVNDALVAIQQAASLRAAVEAKHLGYDIFEVMHARDLSRVEARRGSDQSAGGISESDYTWGGTSHYTDSVELEIEITVRLVEGAMPNPIPVSYVDVNEVLFAYGLAE